MVFYQVCHLHSGTTCTDAYALLSTRSWELHVHYRLITIWNNCSTSNLPEDYVHNTRNTKPATLLWGRVVALYRTKAAYSHQTFPSTICLSVCLPVCPVHCGEMADRIWMRFEMVGRMGPVMRQLVGFGGWSTGGVIWGRMYGAPFVTNGQFLDCAWQLWLDLPPGMARRPIHKLLFAVLLHTCSRPYHPCSGQYLTNDNC